MPSPPGSWLVDLAPSVPRSSGRRQEDSATRGVRESTPVRTVYPRSFGPPARSTLDSYESPHEWDIPRRTPRPATTEAGAAAQLTPPQRGRGQREGLMYNEAELVSL